MTYSLRTLSNPRSTPAQPKSGARRFASELGLFLTAAWLLFWLLALLTHNAHDPAWLSLIHI